MSFKGAFVLGFGFYVGHALAKAIDIGLGRLVDNRSISQTTADSIAKAGIKSKQKSEIPEETVIGFKA